MRYLKRKKVALVENKFKQKVIKEETRRTKNPRRSRKTNPQKQKNLRLKELKLESIENQL